MTLGDALRELLASYESREHGALAADDVIGAEVAQRRRETISCLISRLTTRHNRRESKARRDASPQPKDRN
jgi:hypothetical protein